MHIWHQGFCTHFPHNLQGVVQLVLLNRIYQVRWSILQRCRTLAFSRTAGKAWARVRMFFLTTGSTKLRYCKEETSWTYRMTFCDTHRPLHLQSSPDSVICNVQVAPPALKLPKSNRLSPFRFSVGKPTGKPTARSKS